MRLGALARVVLLTGAWLGASAALAHPLAPSLVEVRELSPGRAELRFKQPVSRAPGSELRPLVPEACVPAGPPDLIREGTGVVVRWEVECAEPLIGAKIAVEGIAGSRAPVLLRVSLADGRRFVSVLTPARPSFVVPEREDRSRVLQGYTRMGVEHLLTGWDHLLFVLGLVMLVPGRRRLVWTVTAFTAGHSVTLALAVLGFVKVPQQPAEAAIALSLFFLAVELGRAPDAGPSLMRRFPWAMAGLFGLLHGLGFAGVLREVGLPVGEIPLALFSFNLGIELGQIGFVVLALAGLTLLRSMRIAGLAREAQASGYVIGSLAAFWFLQRSAEIVSTPMAP